MDGGASGMAGDLLSLLGGIGLFLFGMQTMTAALRDLAGLNRVSGARWPAEAGPAD